MHLFRASVKSEHAVLSQKINYSHLRGRALVRVISNETRQTNTKNKFNGELNELLSRAKHGN